MAAPPPFTIPRDTAQEKIGRKTRRKGKRGSKGRARGADVPSYSVSPATRWKGSVVRIANPIQRSRVDLYRCSCCREFMLEGSKRSGWCVTCGTRHPNPDPRRAA